MKSSYWKETWGIGIFQEIQNRIKSETELGMSFMVHDLVFQFQMICIRGRYFMSGKQWGRGGWIDGQTLDDET